MKLLIITDCLNYLFKTNNCLFLTNTSLHPGCSASEISTFSPTLGLYKSLLNDKEFCFLLIGLNSIFSTLPQSEYTSRALSIPRVQWVHLAWGIFGPVSIFVYCLFGVSTLSNQRRNFISSRPIKLQKKVNFFFKFKIFKTFHINVINFVNFKIYKISKLSKIS